MKDMAEKLPGGAYVHNRPGSLPTFTPNGVHLPSVNDVAIAVETKGTEPNGFPVARNSTFPNAESNGTVSPSVVDGPVITNNKISFQPVQDRSTESNMLYQTHSIDEAPRSGARDSMESKHDHEHETERVEQDEPGVYITLAQLPGGEKDLKRVRFSRKKFSEREAEHWWAENRARVYEHYNVRIVQRTNIVPSSTSGRLENIGKA
ncbi:hypothetical protein KI387_020505 [Taxus chinensis]|uniref:BRX domain-containing protein n=1 Tax=Taxus chinensis TaxID=29808 RepID=A0AA38G8S8_TAXCH|nr:hypothetical protein KI387_020505 [Taxus chinensis]